MDYQSFITTVEQKAQLSGEEAETAACVTLHTLVQRISPGEAEDLAKRLPPELGRCMNHDGPPAQFHLTDFYNRVEKQLGVDRAAAERVARAVLAALSAAAGPKEFADLRSQLPGDFLPLLEAAVAEAPRLPKEEPTFVGSLSYDELLDRVAGQTGLGREQAQKAAEAALEVLAMRVTAGQVDDLRPFLPYELRPALDRGLALSNGLAEPMPLDAFLDEIAQREGVSRDEAREHARAVLAVLREAVGDKEFRDTMAQLPRDYEAVLPQG
jgi:uncharacterized protein (DUF2267 family)